MMKKNILLVDEDILVLKALKRSLHKFKDQWTVYYAQSPRAALEQLDQGTIDVLITEVRHTAADGELFLRSLLIKPLWCILPMRLKKRRQQGRQTGLSTLTSSI